MKKVIKSMMETRQMGTIPYTYYEDTDPIQDLDNKILQGVHAYCFYNGKLVIVYDGQKKSWTPAGGHIEKGETIEEAVIREVKEEANMKVLHQELIGFIDVEESKDRTIRQTRSFCIVEPYGPFICDPDGDITEIKLIDPKDYKKYFDWGEVGDRIMERALELLKDLK